MTVYSLDLLLSQSGTSLLLHVQFLLLLLDLCTYSSGGRSGGLAFPPLEEFPQFVVIHTVRGFDIVNKAEIDDFLMLKILQAKLQQYMNRELPDVQAGFRKGRGTRDQIANIRWIIEKAREFQKNMYFCFIDYAKAFDCVDHNKLWKTLQEMGILDHLTCLLKNLYAGQEATELNIS